MHGDCMRLYHGCDKQKKILLRGVYVSRSRKDAIKFGYRRAVMSNSPVVYLHVMEEVQPEEVERDETRDKAYILKESLLCKVEDMWWTHEAPYKLSKFKRG